MKRISLIIFMLLLSVNAHAAIVTEQIDYSSDAITMKGFLAYDDAIEGTRPGILVVHEWWGHNDYARNRAIQLAELGYTAFAVDMYGDGKVAEHPKEAGEFAMSVSQNGDVRKKRFLAALDILKAQPTVKPDQIAAIGYCFGGGTLLEMARAGVDINGVVSFHGSLKTQTPAQPGAVKAKILVCHGGADTFVPEDDITAFKDEMDQAGAQYTFISYPNAKHSFTNPQATELGKKFELGVAYNKEADEQSWIDMQKFFGEIFSSAN